MRLLSVGPDHVGYSSAREQSAPNRYRHRRCDVRQHLPLRDLCAHSRRDQAGREGLRKRAMAIITTQAAVADQPSDLSRRKFLATAAAGGAFMLGLRLPGVNSAETTFAPNAFIRIGGDGRIVLIMPYVEMGQDTYTSIPMLIAEELEVDLKQVQLEHAPPNEKLYANPLLGVQATGNSNAIRGAWQPLRQAGATARTMLVATAAKRWNVDPASCRVQRGEVLHPATGRRLTYGMLAADAARMPVPAKVALKEPKDFKLIGTPAKRLDLPAKINGTAVFGIDARPPGVKIATLAPSPVFGGRVKR